MKVIPCQQDMDNQTPEERQVRLKKADSIRRMLADQSATGMNSIGESGSSMDNETRQQLDEEKKQRNHLLALNQVIAQQVLEKSRMVAGNYLVIIMNFVSLYLSFPPLFFRESFCMCIFYFNLFFLFQAKAINKIDSSSVVFSLRSKPILGLRYMHSLI